MVNINLKKLYLASLLSKFFKLFLFTSENFISYPGGGRGVDNR